MSASSPVLAIIPVRGGSKRIPRKWAQLVGGKPLLQWTIDAARATRGIDRLVISTEDEAITSYAGLRGVGVVGRPADLAADDVPIRDVVRHVVDTLGWCGTVLVLQATCPLLRPSTIEEALKAFAGGRWGHEWMISGVRDPHIFWQHGVAVVPRVNSQYLGDAALVRESGAIQLFAGPNAIAGGGTGFVLPIDPVEALDIDTYADLEAARAAASRKTILFHVVASDEKGSGHLRRCLQLSDALAGHRIVWRGSLLEGWARAEAEAHGIRFDDTQTAEPDLVIIDALDAADYLAPNWAAQGVKTVVIEPDGRPAVRFADLVIDEFTTPSETILRPEFLCLPPYMVREKAENVLVTFGGTDPTGMNTRVSRLLRHGADGTILVAGQELQGSMAEWLRWADLVVTSQGRTVHEAAACGVPCLSIAVNERESRHAQLPGVVYMGLSACIADSLILDAVNRLLGSAALRQEMSSTADRQIDGLGLRRVVRRIEDLLEGVA